MRFTATKLADAWVVEPELHQDNRGLFARTYCAREFGERGLRDSFVQCNTSWNEHKGALRGLHYQLAPSSEVKLVRCTAGALLDVIVDLRPDSSTYLQYVAVELTANQMSEFYAPKLARGLRYDDPKLGINWPLSVTSISDRDQAWVLLA